MYKVEFKNLGRNNERLSKCFDHIPNYHDLYKLAKKHLISSSIDFVNGVVYIGGFRSGGRYEITEVEEEK